MFIVVTFIRKHFYVGSANFDWRSLTQVKEIGVLAFNCPTLSEDMSKIFEVYWMLGGRGKNIPPRYDVKPIINPLHFMEKVKDFYFVSEALKLRVFFVCFFLYFS